MRKWQDYIHHKSILETRPSSPQQFVLPFPIPDTMLMQADTNSSHLTIAGETHQFSERIQFMTAREKYKIFSRGHALNFFKNRR